MTKPFFFILFTVLLCSASCSSDKAAFKTGSIAAGNLQVYYEESGEGEPIVLLHAGLQDHTMWNEQVNALSAHYRVITPDLPFHGKTTGVDTTILAQDVIRILLDSLQVQKISIAGLSMGAAVAQDFIIAYPQRVSKAFLISSGVNGYEIEHPIDSVSGQWWEKFKTALDGGDTTGAAVEFTRAWAEGIYRSTDSLKSPVSQFVYNTTLANLRLHKMQGWPSFQNHPPAIEKLSSVQVPVLIIDGDKDLPYIIAASAYLEKNIPGAKRLVMKNVAHMLNMEKPAELNKMMLDFLSVKQ